MLPHAEEHIVWAESTEASHRNMLAEFTEKVWPTYEHYGISKDTALLVWWLNRIDTGQDAIIELLKECPCQDGEAEDEAYG